MPRKDMLAHRDDILGLTLRQLAHTRANLDRGSKPLEPTHL